MISKDGILDAIAFHRREHYVIKTMYAFKDGFASGEMYYVN